MDSGNWGQILDEAVCISLHTFALGNSKHPSLLLSCNGQIIRLTGLFAPGTATSLGEGSDSGDRPSVLYLKLKFV